MRVNHRAAIQVVLTLVVALPAAAQAPTRAEVDALMGLPSQGDEIRGQLDTVGFVVGAAAAEEVVAAAEALEAESIAAQDLRLKMDAVEGFIGGVCPHDDHLYASRVYVHLTERITAPRVILIGVFHKASLWNLSDRLVFDSFESWHAPWAPMTVDPLRDELLAALPEGAYVIDNAMHSREHSLEALLPFLQRGYPKRSIVPILVPYMGWDRIEALSDLLAAALVDVMEPNGWRLGRDLAIVISSDAVHYGPDFDYTPFGTDVDAYIKAVAQDHELIAADLEGPLRPQALRQFLYTLVDESDVHTYLRPWCGRFSIPFGLELLRKVAIATEDTVPSGSLLAYGTSLSEPELPVSPAAREAGLGYTAPSNFYHWVGYASIGYTLPE